MHEAQLFLILARCLLAIDGETSPIRQSEYQTHVIIGYPADWIILLAIIGHAPIVLNVDASDLLAVLVEAHNDCAILSPPPCSPFLSSHGITSLIELIQHRGRWLPTFNRADAMEVGTKFIPTSDEWHPMWALQCRTYLKCQERHRIQPPMVDGSHWGVVLNFCPFMGTSVGRFLQDMTELVIFRNDMTDAENRSFCLLKVRLPCRIQMQPIAFLMAGLLVGISPKMPNYPMTL